MLPGISIEFQNGTLGQLQDMPDGCFGLLASATAIDLTFELNKAYQIRSMRDVAQMGIKPDAANYKLHKTIREFYNEAGEGTELWIYGIEKTKKVSEWFVEDSETGVSIAESFLNATKGKLRALFTSYDPDSSISIKIENGLDEDVAIAVNAAQILAENYTTNKFSPYITVLEAYAFTGDKVALETLTDASNNRIALVIGDSEPTNNTPENKGAATGVIAGRLAKVKVHTNIGKVRDGSIKPLKMYVGDVLVEQYDITALHNKGFISFRHHQGKTGYFITDDPLATSETDDYHYIARRRVIDKAYRVAYTALLDFLLDSTMVQNDGTISPLYAQVIENAVESAIYSNMTVNGELSYDETDPNDRGCICEIDRTNNVTATSQLRIAKLQVRPMGYNRFIDVKLGYIPTNIE